MSASSTGDVHHSQEATGSKRTSMHGPDKGVKDIEKVYLQEIWDAITFRDGELMCPSGRFTQGIHNDKACSRDPKLDGKRSSNPTAELRGPHHIYVDVR